MSKLTIQAVNKAHQAAADANTRANEAHAALRERVKRDCALAAALWTLVGAVEQAINGTPSQFVPVEFRDQLEPTANSYGFTLTDHPIRRDLVVVQPLEN